MRKISLFPVTLDEQNLNRIKARQAMFAQNRFGQTVEGRIPARAAYHALYMESFENLKLKLSNFALRGVLIACMMNLEAFTRIKLHFGSENTTGVLAQNSVLTRCLIEFLYSEYSLRVISSGGPNPIPSDELANILSEVHILIVWRNYLYITGQDRCDELVHGLRVVGEEIQSPSFIQDLMMDWALAKDRVEKWGPSYPDDNLERMYRHWESEFGLNVGGWHAAIESLFNFGLESPVVDIDLGSMLSILGISGIGLEQARKFIKRITYFGKRGSFWDSTKNRRRHSPANKPLFLLRRDGRFRIVYSPAFMRENLTSLRRRIEHLGLPGQFFRSSAMRGHTDQTTKMVTSQFERSVGSLFEEDHDVYHSVKIPPDGGRARAEIDVLAISHKNRCIYLIECKASSTTTFNDQDAAAEIIDYGISNGGGHYGQLAMARLEFDNNKESILNYIGQSRVINYEVFSLIVIDKLTVAFMNYLFKRNDCTLFVWATLRFFLEEERSRGIRFITRQIEIMR